MGGYKRRKGFDCASIFSRRPIYDTHVCDEQTDRQTNSIYTACYAVAVRGKITLLIHSLVRSFIHRLLRQRQQKARRSLRRHMDVGEAIEVVSLSEGGKCRLHPR